MTEIIGKKQLRKFFCFVLALAFLLQSVSSGHSQEIFLNSNVLNLPRPGAMVGLSQAFQPPVLKGLKVDPQDPLRFDFIMDRGDQAPANDAQTDVANRLIRYFLASLTVPEKDLWVNLSPYEKDRIVPEAFGKTEMGRDLLAEDYLLKQITSSLIYPEGEAGRKFWAKVYEAAYQKYGTTDIPVDTFNKVWITPEKAVVYENVNAGTAYIVETRLKVMLESDYLAQDVILRPKAEGSQNPAIPRPSGARNDGDISKETMRSLIIPILEKEVNEGANFAQLRQVYHSLILAAWYKKKIKESLLSQAYADRNKVAGVEYERSLMPTRGHLTPQANDLERGKVSPSMLPTSQPLNMKAPQGASRIDDRTDVQWLYDQYFEAFKKGAFNYIKEEKDALTREVIPRKYFSGGCAFQLDRAMRTTSDSSLLKTAARAFVVIGAVVNFIGAAPAFSATGDEQGTNALHYIRQMAAATSMPSVAFEEQMLKEMSALVGETGIKRLLGILDRPKPWNDLASAKSEFLAAARELEGMSATAFDLFVRAMGFDGKKASPVDPVIISPDARDVMRFFKEVDPAVMEKFVVLFKKLFHARSGENFARTSPGLFFQFLKDFRENGTDFFEQALRDFPGLFNPYAFTPGDVQESIKAAVGGINALPSFDRVKDPNKSGYQSYQTRGVRELLRRYELSVLTLFIRTAQFSDDNRIKALRAALAADIVKPVIEKSVLAKRFQNGGDIFDWLMDQGFFEETRGVEGRVKPVTDPDKVRRLEEAYPTESRLLKMMLQQSFGPAFELGAWNDGRVGYKRLEAKDLPAFLAHELAGHDLSAFGNLPELLMLSEFVADIHAYALEELLGRDLKFAGTLRSLEGIFRRGAFFQRVSAWLDGETDPAKATEHFFARRLQMAALKKALGPGIRWTEMYYALASMDKDFLDGKLSEDVVKSFEPLAQRTNGVTVMKMHPFVEELVTRYFKLAGRTFNGNPEPSRWKTRDIKVVAGQGLMSGSDGSVSKIKVEYFVRILTGWDNAMNGDENVNVNTRKEYLTTWSSRHDLFDALVGGTDGLLVKFLGIERIRSDMQWAEIGLGGGDRQVSEENPDGATPSGDVYAPTFFEWARKMKELSPNASLTGFDQNMHVFSQAGQAVVRAVAKDPKFSGLSVKQGGFKSPESGSQPFESLEKDHYDVIRALNVLQHHKDAQADFRQQAFEALKEGGIFIEGDGPFYFILQKKDGQWRPRRLILLADRKNDFVPALLFDLSDRLTQLFPGPNMSSLKTFFSHEQIKGWWRTILAEDYGVRMGRLLEERFGSPGSGAVYEVVKGEPKPDAFKADPLFVFDLDRYSPLGISELREALQKSPEGVKVIHEDKGLITITAVAPENGADGDWFVYGKGVKSLSGANGLGRMFLAGSHEAFELTRWRAETKTGLKEWGSRKKEKGGVAEVATLMAFTALYYLIKESPRSPADEQNKENLKAMYAEFFAGSDLKKNLSGRYAEEKDFLRSMGVILSSINGNRIPQQKVALMRQVVLQYYQKTGEDLVRYAAARQRTRYAAAQYFKGKKADRDIVASNLLQYYGNVFDRRGSPVPRDVLNYMMVTFLEQGIELLTEGEGAPVSPTGLADGGVIALGEYYPVGDPRHDTDLLTQGLLRVKGAATAEQADREVEALASAFPQGFEQAAEWIRKEQAVITPVPKKPGVMNPLDAIGRKLSQLSGGDFLSGALEIDPGRTKESQLEQTGLMGRVKNTFGIFRATPQGETAVAGRAVLFCEDVLTTWATSNAVKRASSAAGAKKVIGFVLGRTVKRDEQVIEREIVEALLAPESEEDREDKAMTRRDFLEQGLALISAAVAPGFLAAVPDMKAAIGVADARPLDDISVGELMSLMSSKVEFRPVKNEDVWKSLLNTKGMDGSFKAFIDPLEVVDGKRVVHMRPDVSLSVLAQECLHALHLIVREKSRALLPVSDRDPVSQDAIDFFQKVKAAAREVEGIDTTMRKIVDIFEKDYVSISSVVGELINGEIDLKTAQARTQKHPLYKFYQRDLGLDKGPNPDLPAGFNVLFAKAAPWDQKDLEAIKKDQRVIIEETLASSFTVSSEVFANLVSAALESKEEAGAHQTNPNNPARIKELHRLLHVFIDQIAARRELQGLKDFLRQHLERMGLPVPRAFVDNAMGFSEDAAQKVKPLFGADIIDTIMGLNLISRSDQTMRLGLIVKFLKIVHPLQLAAFKRVDQKWANALPEEIVAAMDEILRRPNADDEGPLDPNAVKALALKGVVDTRELLLRPTVGEQDLPQVLGTYSFMTSSGNVEGFLKDEHLGPRIQLYWEQCYFLLKATIALGKIQKPLFLPKDAVASGTFYSYLMSVIDIEVPSAVEKLLAFANLLLAQAPGRNAHVRESIRNYVNLVEKLSREKFWGDALAKAGAKKVLKTLRKAAGMDPAQADTGGIDLTFDRLNVETTVSGGEIQFTIDPAMLARLRAAPGLAPVIISVEPMTDLSSFLGVIPRP